MRYRKLIDVPSELRRQGGRSLRVHPEIFWPICFLEGFALETTQSGFQSIIVSAAIAG